jgi:hypothetical protein
MTERQRSDRKVMPAQPVPATSPHYRPRSYFGACDLETWLLTHVKGRERRRFIREALEAGELDLLPEPLIAAELTREDRSALGGLHPGFMGGEYLPRMKKDEVEIARISINSTTSDVTVVYARPVGKRIAYRVADEYEGDTLEGRTHRTSTRPLTMAQLIDFFLGAWDLCLCLEANYENDLDGMLSFFWAESEYYPGLDDALRALVEARYPPSSDDEDWETDREDEGSEA